LRAAHPYHLSALGLVDLLFFTANAEKIPAGGWFPVRVQA